MADTNKITDDDLDDLEDFQSIPIDTDPLQSDNAILDQGHGMFIGDRIKLASREVVALKKIVDTAINPTKSEQEEPSLFNVSGKIQGLKIPDSSEKLKNIGVTIETINGRILVKVGPCDLSGVGGHHVREQIIKNVVNQALQAKGLEATYETVNVSACVSVRGRLQMATGVFIDNRKDSGTHMNAYVKTDKEATLTHWEPRKGPQSFFNDTICAMVTSVCTSLFEQGIRDNQIHSSAEATNNILKSSALKNAFDHLLSTAKDRITNLIDSVKKMVGIKNELQKIKGNEAEPATGPTDSYDNESSNTLG